MLGFWTDRSRKQMKRDEDIALKSNTDTYDDIDGDGCDDDGDDSSVVTSTTFTTTTTCTTKQSTKFTRFRSRSKNKKRFESYNEYELTGKTEMTQTDLTQTNITETNLTQTETNALNTNGDDDIIPIRSGDEIKCCNKIDIYTALYIIFGYNAFIALLLIFIIIWTLYKTYSNIAYFIIIWSVLFLFIRIYIFVLGIIIVPQMIGLHGNELRYLKEKYLKFINICSVFMLYGPIVFNMILIIVFIIYSIFLLISDIAHLFILIDVITVKFLLFAMAFISIIAIVDTFCEIMFYDTVKKFMEAKLECTLCSIPCTK